MALSQDIIYYRLSQAFPARFSIRTELEEPCLRPVLFEPERDLSHCAIVISPADLGRIDCSDPAYYNGLFVCLGAPPDIRIGASCSLIVLECPEGECADATAVINTLSAVFAEFSSWEGEMNGVVHGNGGFQEISDCSEHLFDDPFCVQDQDFYYISYSHLFEEQSLQTGQINANNSSPLSIIYKFMANPQFTLMETSKVAQFLSFSFGDTVIKNLFNGADRVGMVMIMVETIDDRLFWYYSALLDTMTGYLELLYSRQKGFSRNPSSKDRLRGYLVDFLNRKTVSPSHLERALEENGWQLGDEYHLIQVKPDSLHDGCLNSRNIILTITRDWKGSIAFEYYDKLLMLENVDLFASKNNQPFMPVLEAFLEEYHLIAGVSRSFDDFQCIDVAFEQTETAFSYGQKISPGRLCWLFDEFALNYMLECCLGAFEPKDICSEKLLRLMQYDKDKKSEMCKTLSTYIDCHYNASAAAEKLCIHRTSFLNRLERIREISGIDLDSSDELLHYTLSQRILG